MHKFAHHTATDTRQVWLGIEKNSLYITNSEVNISLLTLILKVTHTSHSLYYKAGALIPGKVYREIGIRLNLYLRLICI